MNQKNPTETSKFENPAWQKTNKTLVKWYDEIAKEFKKVKKEKPSAEKAKKLQELGDLMGQFRSQFTSLYEGIEAKTKSGVLSNNQKWKAPGLTSKDFTALGTGAGTAVDTQIGLIEAEIKANAAAMAAPAPTKGTTKKGDHPVVKAVNGPGSLVGPGPFTFSIDVSGGNPPYTYEWKGYNAPQIMRQGTQYSSISIMKNEMRSPGANQWFVFVSVKDSAGEYATWGTGKWEYTYGVIYTPPQKDADGKIIKAEKWEVITEP